MSQVDARTVEAAREYVKLSREVKQKKERMKVLLEQLGPKVVPGVIVPDLGVRLVQHTGKYRAYPTTAFHGLLGLDALLACATIDPVKVDQHLGTLPPLRRAEVERQLAEILKVTLKPRHVVESLTPSRALASAL